MKYFIDTEFHEYKKRVGLIGFKKEVETIDLISIGIVCEDGREYYAINKDFDIKSAWNNVWLRENVLSEIYDALLSKVGMYGKTHHYNLMQYNIKGVKNLLRWNGQSKKDIANDICAFIYGDDCGGSGMSAIEMATKYEISDKTKEPEFYAYYADYDWVVFCWLFGRMIDLPKGFPMYCKDLKQNVDELVEGRFNKEKNSKSSNYLSKKEILEHIKNNPNYPKQKNEHNALADAKWNHELYNFLKSI